MLKLTEVISYVLEFGEGFYFLLNIIDFDMSVH